MMACDNARKLSQSLAPFERKPKAIEFDKILTDMQEDTVRMKGSLATLGNLLSKMAPFSPNESGKMENQTMVTKYCGGSNKLVLDADLRCYRPEELSVKVVGNQLQEPHHCLELFQESNELKTSNNSLPIRPLILAQWKTVAFKIPNVTAEHHENNGLAESHRKYTRQFLLPPDVDIHSVIPKLTPEGFLLVEVDKK